MYKFKIVKPAAYIELVVSGWVRGLNAWKRKQQLLDNKKLLELMMECFHLIFFSCFPNNRANGREGELRHLWDHYHVREITLCISSNGEINLPGV